MNGIVNNEREKIKWQRDDRVLISLTSATAYCKLVNCRLLRTPVSCFGNLARS